MTEHADLEGTQPVEVKPDGVPMDDSVNMSDEEWEAYERLYLRQENEHVISHLYHSFLRTCDLVKRRLAA